MSMSRNPHHNYQPARPTSRLATIIQTLLVAAIVAALTVAFTLELAK